MDKHRHWPIILTGMALATAIGIAAVATFLSVKGEGSQYQFTGVNRYNLLTVDPPDAPYTGCGGVFTDAELVTWFDELEGVNAIRFWAFQSFTPLGFTRFDRVLQLAGERNIKVMPVLENNWDHCTQGGVKLDTWYASGYKSPYGSYTKSLPDHIREVVGRYKDDPRILMWQVMNEAGIATSGGTCGSFDTFKAFAADTTGLVKALDPDTPVSFGTLGSGQCGARGAEYQSLHDIASIDYCEYHDYWEPATAMPDDGHNRLRQRLDQCAALGKPLFVGEAGIQCSDDACRATRAVQIDAKMAAARDAGVAGYLIWAYRDRTGCCTSWEYGPGDPLTSVVASYGAPSQTPTSTITRTPTATVTPTPTPTKICKNSHSRWCR